MAVGLAGQAALTVGSALLPHLLKKIGLGANESDTEASREMTQQQAKTQDLLQQNLQAGLRGEETPGTRAITNRLQQQQNVQRRTLASDQGQRYSQSGVGGGSSFRRGELQRQNTEFNRMLLDVLSQNQLNAQQVAAGQGALIQRSQHALAAQEQEQITAFSKGLGRIYQSITSPGSDKTLQSILDIIKGNSQSPTQPTAPTQPTVPIVDDTLHWG